MLVRFEELTDDQWKLLVPSIPAPAHTGSRPRADDRSTINGVVLYVLMSGCRWMDGWMDMPPKYAFYKTVWERHNKKWSTKGIWKNIMNSLVSRGYTSGLINIDDLSVDSSTVASKKGDKK
jgi:putative transposase